VRNLRGETTLNGTSKGRWKKWIKMKQKSEGVEHIFKRDEMTDVCRGKDGKKLTGARNEK
jgi:hypothetical protein